MQLAQQIKMRQSQSLVMTPQLQQAIKLLQMTNIELCQYLENQQSENPFLEIETSVDSKSSNDQENKDENITSNISDDFKNGNSISDDPSNNQDYENRYETEVNERPKLDTPGTNLNKVTPEDFDDYIDNLANKPETLKEHIQKQISLELKTPKDLVIASFLIDYLEPTGWISNDLDQISKETECDIKEIEEVLFKLQKLEPREVFLQEIYPSA